MLGHAQSKYANFRIETFQTRHLAAETVLEKANQKKTIPRGVSTQNNPARRGTRWTTNKRGLFNEKEPFVFGRSR